MRAAVIVTVHDAAREAVETGQRWHRRAMVVPRADRDRIEAPRRLGSDHEAFPASSHVAHGLTRRSSRAHTNPAAPAPMTATCTGTVVAEAAISWGVQPEAETTWSWLRCKSRTPHRPGAGAPHRVLRPRVPERAEPHRTASKAGVPPEARSQPQSGPRSAPTATPPGALGPPRCAAWPPARRARHGGPVTARATAANPRMRARQVSAAGPFGADYSTSGGRRSRKPRSRSEMGRSSRRAKSRTMRHCCRI